PNQGECFGRGTATFLLLGPSCTRRCTFCAIEKEDVLPPQDTEPDRIAQAVDRMGLTFCVLTMVTRDDLPDGGAGHVVRSISAIRKRCPEVGIEVLISDLGGNQTAMMEVLEIQPEVLNHNIETVPRLYPEVRPQADYRRSLDLLSRADTFKPRPVTKSGMMLGLGETRDEILKAMDDLRAAGCDLLTLGQYLSPSQKHHPVERYVPPEEFDELKAAALDRGFIGVASHPYVRSSYQAEQLFKLASGTGSL
ncbi:MAG: lipoyl synthase, partial [Deltaproteobacteria bacterium]|nr:lipoyl synthase [Deltaproteobacteria bacterium]